MHNTLLWRRAKSVVHLSAHGNELDDLVLLPMPGVLQHLHVVLCVIQIHNLDFFSVRLCVASSALATRLCFLGESVFGTPLRYPHTVRPRRLELVA